MKKILIADDEDLIRVSLSRILEKKGFQVIQAKDGHEAYLLWKEHKPDMVFLDYFMPQMTGLEVLEKIPAELKTKIVVISAFLEDSDKEKFKLEGAVAFYKKPFENIFDLVEVVTKKV